MDIIRTLEYEFDKAISRFNSSPTIEALFKRELRVEHYKSILREIYHYAKEDPQIQALATVHFRGHDRLQVKSFLRHALSETGHDLMALADLQTLGDDISEIPISRPLPATVAFTSYPFYLINYDNPVGYLGYLYFLEFMPTQHGSRYAAALIDSGVPIEALSFLQEHMTVDVGHNRLMHKYLTALVHDQADLEAVIYAMHVTAELYAQMLGAAIQRVDTGVNYGIAVIERHRSGGVPVQSLGGCDESIASPG